MRPPLRRSLLGDLVDLLLLLLLLVMPPPDQEREERGEQEECDGDGGGVDDRVVGFGRRGGRGGEGEAEGAGGGRWVGGAGDVGDAGGVRDGEVEAVARRRGAVGGGVGGDVGGGFEAGGGGDARVEAAEAVRRRGEVAARGVQRGHGVVPDDRPVLRGGGDAGAEGRRGDELLRRREAGLHEGRSREGERRRRQLRPVVLEAGRGLPHRRDAEVARGADLLREADGEHGQQRIAAPRHVPRPAGAQVGVPRERRHVAQIERARRVPTPARPIHPLHRASEQQQQRHGDRPEQRQARHFREQLLRAEDEWWSRAA
uniref:Uncharacterized protein n=1 Tax=Oryza glumipatula TaxID=40148 RepID=A0A0D9ZZD8_9ORYZ